MILLHDPHAMTAFLSVIGGHACRDKWDTTAAKQYTGFTQYTCMPPTNKWHHATTLTFSLADGAQTPPLPLDNFVHVATVDGQEQVQLLVLGSTHPPSHPPSHPPPGVLGMPFFVDQWIEFDLSEGGRGVRLATATSEADVWG